MMQRPARETAVELAFGEIVRVHGGQPVLVLREKAGVRKLALPVSRAEAAMIERSLHGPHGLASASVEALGGRVLGASIDRVTRDRGFRGHLAIGTGSRELRIDSAAGEALAIALQAGAPIVADPEVLDEAAISPDDLHGKSARSLRSDPSPAPVLHI
jgi:bifunctional DNase/RNase